MIYLLGDGDYREKLQKYIHNNNLTTNVKILGFVKNPYPYINSSIATVLISFSEGFSLALVESVILNTPIISTNVGIAKELVDKYNCGHIIHNDEKELSMVLLEYMSNCDERNKVFNINDDYDIISEVKKTKLIIIEANYL